MNISANEYKLLYELCNRWDVIARPEQLPPREGAYDTWLILAGRGWGKTRVGAEWVATLAHKHPGCRIACVAPTAADARDVMAKGESGILHAVSNKTRPLYEPSKRSITWANGSIAMLFSAEEPDRLRGHQHNFMWCDEVATWKYRESWDMALLGLRLGDHPMACVTTTPKPTPIVKSLLAGKRTHVTRGTTFDNAANLSPSFITNIISKYEGTRLGRQELYAEVLEDVEGALWTRDMIDEARVDVDSVPVLERIVVAIDPAVSTNPESSETGIVCAGISKATGFIYVLEDASVKASADTWSRRAVNLYHKWQADRIIGEENQGGDLIKKMLTLCDDTISYRSVRATRGKALRAEPVQALYEQGKVKHVGNFPHLEDQMCGWVPGDKISPDRLDALVWAVTDLMGSARKKTGFVLRGGSYA